MDLSAYSLEDLIVAAVKAETEAKGVYGKLASGVKNAYLKEKLQYLADEEEKHRAFMEDLYKSKFPGKTLVLPDESPVPMPEIEIRDEGMDLSEVLESAMEAEKAARDFYHELSKKFGAEPETKQTLEYFASMEWGHYKLLEIEKENALHIESYNEYWPMMHIGG